MSFLESSFPYLLRAVRFLSYKKMTVSQVHSNTCQSMKINSDNHMKGKTQDLAQKRHISSTPFLPTSSNKCIKSSR